MSSALMLILGLLGARNLLLGGIVLSGYCAFCFYRNYLFARRLNVRRFFPAEAIEREVITVRYEITNLAKMVIPRLKLEDSHNLSRSGLIGEHFENLRGEQKRLHSSQVVLDNGMGVKSFSSVVLTISDSLELFPFKVLFDMKDNEVQVHPKVDECYWLPKQGNPHSFSHGLYHEPFSGEGVEFLGVREYRTGDAIKKLNWKQMAKRDELVVNEFEKVTNSRVLIYLERNIKVHFGLGANSTWELARDVALGLASHNLQSMNSVTVVARDYSSGPGQGTRFLKKLELELATLDLVETSGNDTSEVILYEYERHSGTVLLWISPLVNSAEIEKGLVRLEHLARKGQKGLFVALVGVMNVARELDPQLVPYLKSLGEREKEARRVLAQRLHSQGIGYCEVTFEFCGGPLAESYEI